MSEATESTVPSHIETLDSLETSFPGLLEFTRWSPYGLLAEELAEPGHVTCRVYPTFVWLGWSSEVIPTALIPPIVRLSVTVQDQVPLDANENGTAFAEELIWFYSYARAAALAPEVTPSDLLAPTVAERWDVAAKEVMTTVDLNPVQELHVTLLLRYGYTGASLLKSSENRLFASAWDIALETNSYSQFLKSFSEVPGVGQLTLPDGFFLKRQAPRSRNLAMCVYGRKPGILASEDTPWVGSKEKLEELLHSTIVKPLMLADHDPDMPIGLVANQHIGRRPGTADEIHFDLLFTDAEAWSQSDRRKGFSLGVKHGKRLDYLAR